MLCLAANMRQKGIMFSVCPHAAKWDNVFFKSGAKIKGFFEVYKKIPNFLIFSRELSHICYQSGRGIGNLRSYPAYRLKAFTSSVVSSLAFLSRGCETDSQKQRKNQVNVAGGMFSPMATESLLRKRLLLIIGRTSF